MLHIGSFVLLIVFSAAVVAAGDFDWTRDFNNRADADPSGFRTRLGDRFNVSEVQINAVLNSVGRPADAYMIFRLGEMSGMPSNYVIEKYRSQKGQGWGVIAKSLGIKPGSSEFHALKQGNDLYDDIGKSKGKGKGKKK
jgi:hypothetical protein